jgi:phospholipid/cholesterol/gamma-HCH transport system substrate-binding protein
VHAEVKSFAERNTLTLGIAGCLVTAGIVVGATQYDKLPFVSQNHTYSAYFAEAGGLSEGDAVQVFGLRVGKVSGVVLDGARVLVTFNVNKSIHLGDMTEAAVKTKSILGSKFLAVTPRGSGEIHGSIPLQRTTPAYELPDAVGDLTATISGLNTDQLSQSFKTLSETFHDTPPQLKAAIDNLGRFAQSLDARDSALRSLLGNTNKITAVIAERTKEVVDLVADTNALLGQLQTQSKALDAIANQVSALSRQLSGFVADNRDQLKPALDKLNSVLTILDTRKERIQLSIKLANKYVLSLGEAVGSGPFFKAYIQNLLPGQFLQPFVDAAFSDLKLDPNVLLPSQISDPQVGQPGTPALPMPYPRTGQGGEPRLNLPDAITGSLGDPRYPYRQPPDQPAPGGPPPGPPAGYRPGAPPPPQDGPAAGPVEVGP